MRAHSLIPLLWFLALTPAAANVDPAAAEALAKQSHCFKCHLIDRKKESTSWHDIAAKYRGKPEAEEILMHHVTAGDKVKFDDGHEERHKKVKTDDPAQIRNLVDWILSL